jgi:antitoxin HicB
MMHNEYPVYLLPLPESEGGGFAVFVPDLVGCMSDGATADEALANVQDAIAEWIHEAKRLKREIPEPGSAALRAAQEQREMLDLLKSHLSTLDGKIADLEKRIAAIAQAVDQRPESYWAVLPVLRQHQSRIPKPH